MNQSKDTIDIVYLWVDGADPLWRRKRQHALSHSNDLARKKLARYGDVAGRYRDNQELRFNLRALEKFFPDHGHIYLVTDGQIPSWLNYSAGITLIDHTSIIPATALPVFDSGHIESYLHHIPNLSEKFIYLNDDVFFGAPVDADDWFGEHGVAVFKEQTQVPDYNSLQKDETALVNASILSKQWLQQRYPSYQHVHRIFAHAPRPMLKHVLMELEKEAPELFEQVRQTVFRDWQRPPIVPDLVPRWMLHRGLAHLKELDYRYVCSGDADAEQQFNSLIESFGKLAFFCINDTSDNADSADPQLTRISASLEQLLPFASRFELIDSSECV
nr:Stealth CR1 domain-containing protein [uncultured Undibacterium sp.]